MDDAMTPVDPNSPLSKMWEEWKSSDDYANSRKWAMHEDHIEGSLWNAFMRGFMAGECRASTGEGENDDE